MRLYVRRIRNRPEKKRTGLAACALSIIANCSTFVRRSFEAYAYSARALRIFFIAADSIWRMRSALTP